MVPLRGRAFLTVMSGVGLFALACTVYLPYTAVTVQDSDSGELVTAAVKGALLHPPGFPLYALISRLLVRLLSSANPIHVLSAFSAVAQAGAVVGVFAASLLVSRSLLAAVCLAAAWLFYPYTMQSATDVEVFALHHLLAAAVVVFSVKLLDGGGRGLRDACALGLLCGLAAANHQIAILWLPLAAGAVLHSGFQQRGLRGAVAACGAAAAGGAAGLSLYMTLLLPFPLEDAVAFAPLQGVRQLWHHMLRTGYGTFSIKPASGGPVISYFFHFLETSWRYMPLQIVSFFALALFASRRGHVLLLCIFLALALHILFGLRLVMPEVTEVYGQLMGRFYPSLALAAAIGAAAVLGQLRKGSLVYGAALIGVLAPSLLNVGNSLPAADARHDRIVNAELETVLAELPQDAVFLAAQDRIAMGMQCQQMVFGKRRDVVVIIPGLLKSRSYRRVLAGSRKELQSLFADDQLSVEEIVAWASSAGRSVFAYADTPAPPGYAALPIGLTWQWLPLEHKVSGRDIALRLYGFCANWPEELVWENPQRAHSMFVKRRYFYYTLELFARLYEGTPLQKGLQHALHYVRIGDIDRAHLRCRRIYRELAGEAEVPRAYSWPPKS